VDCPSLICEGAPPRTVAIRLGLRLRLRFSSPSSQAWRPSCRLPAPYVTGQPCFPSKHSSTLALFSFCPFSPPSLRADYTRDQQKCTCHRPGIPLCASMGLPPSVRVPLESYGEIAACAEESSTPAAPAYRFARPSAHPRWHARG
jgi:hypothetical protein